MQKWLLILKAWEQACAVAPEALSPLWRCSKTGPHRWWQTDVARITSNTEWPLLNCPAQKKKKHLLLYSLSFSEILHIGLFLLARLVRISHVSVFVCSWWNQFWCHMVEDTLGFVCEEKWMRGWKESWWNTNIHARTVVYWFTHESTHIWNNTYKWYVPIICLNKKISFRVW